ncbi:molybdopterin-binding protein, partial [Methylobacterium trifolii]
MRFGPVPVGEAAGLITAHTITAGGTTLRKGRIIPPETVARLEAEGVRDLVTVSLEPGDVGEDEAAERLARRLMGAGLRAEPPFTGRCNLFAEHAGVLLVGRAAIDAVNDVDEAITAATLPAFRPVVAGEMVATVKIIPYAVAGATLARACAAAR